MRICYTCDEFKELDQFYFRKQRNKYHTTCKECLCKQAKIRDSQSKYTGATKERKRLYMRKRLKTDRNFSILQNLRGRIRKAIKGSCKSGTTEDLLGCSIEQARAHLESQFTEGMTWENYGLHGWHIDHIRPCSSYDLTSPEQQRECFHYTNMQPLWAVDNIKKSNTYYE